MNIKQRFQDALDIMKNGIVTITKEMQSEESVKTIHVRKDRVSSCSTITINGTHIFTSDSCISINIEGDVHTVDTQGSVTCNDVTGSINTNGSVNCGDVTGNVDTNGSVSCGDVGGDIDTNGRVTANNVKGDIDTMGKVIVNSRG